MLYPTNKGQLLCSLNVKCKRCLFDSSLCIQWHYIKNLFDKIYRLTCTS